MAVPGRLERVDAAVREACAALPDQPLVVALSGGPDSAVLAWGCAVARPSGTVRAVHVDHGWAAAPVLVAAAHSVAARVGLPLQVITVDPGSGPSPEDRARRARLGALQAAAGDALVALGHHGDDVVETVVGNLLRGAGAHGLAGIARRRGSFVRPLLHLDRAELRALADALELPYVDDPSNVDTRLRRNLIRSEIVPFLEDQVTGSLREVVTRTAEHLAADDAFLEDAVPPLRVERDGDALLLPAALLATLPPPLAARAARAALRLIHDPYPGSSREVGVVVAVAGGQIQRGDLSDGYVAIREGPHVALLQPKPIDIPEPCLLEVPGEVRFGRHVISAAPASDRGPFYLSRDRARLAVAPDPLVVRAAGGGEGIDLGKGTKTLAAALGEAGVAPRLRPAWPVVEAHGRIAWVAGVRIAAWARTEPSSGKWVELERRTA
jgi:tRNA(Ile)-lysidine synthase